VTLALITGGSGFIGQHLAAALVARGRKVRILDLRPPARNAPELQFVQGSVLDPQAVSAALHGVAEVYHLAALPGMWVPHRSDFHAVNCRGTEIVLAAARERGAPHILHCSSESVLFGRRPAAEISAEDAPVAPDEMPGAYTRSKSCAEMLALRAAAAGAPVVVASPTVPIGPHDGPPTPLTAMLSYFLESRVRGYLDFVMNVVDVRDVAEGLILALERGRVGERYILGGETLRLGELLLRAAMLTGRSSLRIPIPGALAQIVAAGMEFVADHVTHRPPAATVEGVRIALRAVPVSLEKSRRELGYVCRPIEPALRQAIASIIGDRKRSGSG